MGDKHLSKIELPGDLLSSAKKATWSHNQLWVTISVDPLDDLEDPFLDQAPPPGPNFEGFVMPKACCQMEESDDEWESEDDTVMTNIFEILEDEFL